MQQTSSSSKMSFMKFNQQIVNGEQFGQLLLSIYRKVCILMVNCVYCIQQDQGSRTLRDPSFVDISMNETKWMKTTSTTTLSTSSVIPDATLFANTMVITNTALTAASCLTPRTIYIEREEHNSSLRSCLFSVKLSRKPKCSHYAMT